MKQKQFEYKTQRDEALERALQKIERNFSKHPKKFDDYKNYPDYYEKEKKKLVRKPTPEELEEILRIEDELWNS